MINKRLEVELNKQLNAELYSAFMYLSMSAFLSHINLSGFAHWMRIQFEEEQAHALKFYQYIIDRGGAIAFEDIKSSKSEWGDIITVFAEVQKHEAEVTMGINNLMNIAMEEKDHATLTFLQWFVNEQVEEEASVADLLTQLRLIEGKGSGLFMLDREAKQRVFVPVP